MSRKLTVIVVALLLGAVTAVAAEQTVSVRPYLQFGRLMSAPSADDLGYEDVDGASLEEYLDVDKGTMGGGAQLLFVVGPQLKVGADLGFRKLYDSRFDTGASDLDYIYESYQTDKESTIYLMGVAQYSLLDSPVFLQGGLGMHLVFWTWEKKHWSEYGRDDKESSDTEVGLGFMVAGGVNLPVHENLSFPIMLRIDYMFRHGSMIPVSLMAGASFNL